MREFINFAKHFVKEFGEEKAIEFLKGYTEGRWLKRGQNQVKRSPDNSFQTYIKTFKNPRYDKTLTMEIVEDTAGAFELKITECIWAKTFLEAEAGEIGYASICFGDYAWAKGFNPRLN